MLIALRNRPGSVSPLRGRTRGDRLSSTSGERNPSAKLTWQQVRAMRAMLSSGLSQAVVARLFGVGSGHMSQIANCRIWREV